MLDNLQFRVKQAGKAVLLLTLLLLLSACKVEVYSGLTEGQANEMLSVLLKRGIAAEKEAAGKAGYTLSVDEEQLVSALQILKENSLPRDEFESLGSVFSGQSMIASTTEEQARMAYALSQELANTFSRIDGVLTARVHVVLGISDSVNNIHVKPSASVFLRHQPESPVVTLVPNIREAAAKAVSGLSYESVSVMLVPVREDVTVPAQKPDLPFWGLVTAQGTVNWPLVQPLALAVGVLLTVALLAVVFVRMLVGRKLAIAKE